MAEEGFVVDEVESGEGEESEEEEEEAEFSSEDEKETVESSGLNAFLSGKFETNKAEKEPVAPVKSLKVEIVKTKTRSVFVDDEAEDEDEELEAEMFDEEEMARDMAASKFIARDEEVEEGDGEDIRAFHNQRLGNEGFGDILDKIARKYANGDEESLIDRLERNYAQSGDDYDEVMLEGSSRHGKPNSITALLDPTERKRQKLSKLQAMNLSSLGNRHLQPANHEFMFPEERREAERRERRHLDREFAHAMEPGVSSHPTSDFYASATESEYESDASFESLEEREEETMYEEAGAEAQEAEEMDLENEQVQAQEDLSAQLGSMKEEPAAQPLIHLQPSQKRSVLVPNAGDSMRAKLAAMQQSEEAPQQSRVFKGFTLLD